MMRILYILILSLLTSTAADLTVGAGGTVTIGNGSIVGLGAGGIQSSTVTNWNWTATTSTIEFTVAGSQTYLIFAAAVAGTHDVSGVTWNGDAMTLITNAAISSGFGGRVTLFGLVNPDSGTHNLVASVSGVDIEFCASLSLWTGVNQSVPYDGLTVNESTDGDPASSPTSLTVASGVGEKVFTAASVYLGDDVLASAPQTIIASTNNLTVSFGASYTNSTGASISVPFTYSTDPNYWIQAGISLKP